MALAKDQSVTLPGRSQGITLIFLYLQGLLRGREIELVGFEQSRDHMRAGCERGLKAVAHAHGRFLPAVDGDHQDFTEVRRAIDRKLGGIGR